MNFPFFSPSPGVSKISLFRVLQSIFDSSYQNLQVNHQLLYRLVLGLVVVHWIVVANVGKASKELTIDGLRHLDDFDEK